MDIVKRISEFWNNLTSTPELAIGVAISVVVFTIAYFILISFMIENGSNNLVEIFVLVMLISAVIVSMVKSMNSAIFLLVPGVFVLFIFIVYSVEIKRIVWAKKNAKIMDYKRGEGKSYDKEKIDRCINEIIKALQNMSKNDVGAIIVLSTGNIPAQIIDSGVRLDSDISSELIESVFFPKTPLHDGAMIINETEIVAAGCFLPLAQNLDNIPKEFGSRHRAGIGVTETLDVVSLIVSEESGIISIAKQGKISRYADYEALKNVLSRYYWQELDGFRK